MSESTYDRFSELEYERRWSGLDALLEDHDISAVAVYGTKTARGALQYLTAFGSSREAYLCHSPASAPSLYVQLYNHVPTATQMAVIDDVRWAGPDTAETVARDLEQRLGNVRRIGVIGPLPYRHMDRLRRIPDAEIVDLSSAFTSFRLVKSAEEIEWAARGAALTDEAMRALAAAAIPGASEHDLGSAFETAVRRGAGSPGICFLASTPMDRPGRYVPAQQWTDRKLEPGDAVMVEMSAGYGGYTGQALRTITIAAEPSPEFADLHRTADAAFDAIVAAIRAGAQASDLLAAAGVIEEAGFTVCDDVVHGYGGGYLPPVLRTPATQHAPLRDIELRAGMFLVVQPNVITPQRTMGVQTGQLVVVTEDGYRSLHSLPRGFLAGGP